VLKNQQVRVGFQASPYPVLRRSRFAKAQRTPGGPQEKRARIEVLGLVIGPRWEHEVNVYLALDQPVCAQRLLVLPAPVSPFALELGASEPY
jgi:hypothetical protein